MNTVVGCEHAPLQFPTGFSVASIPDCSSCVLRLVAPVASSVTQIQPHVFGTRFEENPLTSFYSNGIEYNCRESVVCVPAAHRLPGMDAVQDANGTPVVCEALFYFQGTLHPNKIACLSVLFTGTRNLSEVDTTYFDALGGESGAKRTSLQDLFRPTDTFLSYTGASFRDRNADDSTPTASCNPVRFPVTYYVLNRIIRIPLRPFHGFALYKEHPTVKGPPVAQPASALLLTSNVTRIEGIRLGEDRARTAAAGGGGGVSTDAMKCVRLDTRRDIVDGKVYVGGTGRPTRTLSKELEEAATDLSYTALHADGGIKPGDVERITGIVVGVLLGLLLIAAITYYVLRGTFGRSYERVLSQSAAAIARANAGAAAAAAP